MKTIIAATDFSDNANNAAMYAADLAHELGTTLSLCHICEPPVFISEIPIPDTGIDDLLSDANKQIGLLKERILLKYGAKLQVLTAVLPGNVITQLNEYCASVQPYALVMGSEKESMLERVLIGGTAFAALTHLQWPLVIVPSDASFDGIMNVAFACDLTDIKTIPVDEIKNIVHRFSAALHVVHVDGKHSSSVRSIDTSLLQDMLSDLHPVYHFLEGDDIENSITAFLSAQNIDLLFIVPKKHSLMGRIFHHSHSKKLVLHSHVPVMAIHQ